MGTNAGTDIKSHPCAVCGRPASVKRTTLGGRVFGPRSRIDYLCDAHAAGSDRPVPWLKVGLAAVAALLLLTALFPPRRLAQYNHGRVGYGENQRLSRKFLFSSSFHSPDVVVEGSSFRVGGRAEVDLGQLAAEALAVLALAALWVLLFTPARRHQSAPDAPA